MKRSRRIAFGLAALSSITVGGGVVAVAATGESGLLGFGREGGETVAAEQADASTTAFVTTTTAMAPVVVTQYEYVDEYVYVRRPAPVTAPAAPPPSAEPAAVEQTTTPPPTSPATTAAPAPTAPPPTAAPTTAGPTTTTRPPVPPGCEEPEWDREHQFWHCKGD